MKVRKDLDKDLFFVYSPRPHQVKKEASMLRINLRTDTAGVINRIKARAKRSVQNERLAALLVLAFILSIWTVVFTVVTSIILLLASLPVYFYWNALVQIVEVPELSFGKVITLMFMCLPICLVYGLSERATSVFLDLRKR